MENIGVIIGWVIFGLVAAAALGLLIYRIVKLAKMPADQRKEQILAYLKEIIVIVENEVACGNQDDEIAQVEAYFQKHATRFIKTLLMLTGKACLKDLIKEALEQVHNIVE